MTHTIVPAGQPGAARGQRRRRAAALLLSASASGALLVTGQVSAGAGPAPDRRRSVAGPRRPAGSSSSARPTPGRGAT